ncbi:hypothetical protein Pcinc_027390 [Petrolisthes cinctipes]|uniref:Uncharacterized protein n=1 Tax=Petrolisthes cinctipes TaxID=88211 RepID=A0AAE1F413_PETCI|nr:hypothetical protein Pcinc_027390 [Petrolisthes cinctipes]
MFSGNISEGNCIHYRNSSGGQANCSYTSHVLALKGTDKEEGENGEKVWKERLKSGDYSCFAWGPESQREATRVNERTKGLSLVVIGRWRAWEQHLGVEEGPRNLHTCLAENEGSCCHQSQRVLELTGVVQV